MGKSKKGKSKSSVTVSRKKNMQVTAKRKRSSPKIIEDCPSPVEQTIDEVSPPPNRKSTRGRKPKASDWFEVPAAKKPRPSTSKGKGAGTQKVKAPRGRRPSVKNVKIEVPSLPSSDDEDMFEMGTRVTDETVGNPSGVVTNGDAALDNADPLIKENDNFLGIAATIRDPEKIFKVDKDVMLSDPLHPSMIRMMSSYLAIPKQHVRVIMKHPLAIALKSSALERHKKKELTDQYSQRCIEIVDQNHHLLGAYDKAIHQNTVLTDKLRKKTNECEKLEHILGMERSRFVVDWSERDKKRIIDEAENHAKEQRFFSDRKFEDVVDVEKQKFEKRLKDIDKDRLSLARENAQLLKQLDRERANGREKKEENEKLKKQVQQLEKKLMTKNKKRTAYNADNDLWSNADDELENEGTTSNWAEAETQDTGLEVGVNLNSNQENEQVAVTVSPGGTSPFTVDVYSENASCFLDVVSSENHGPDPVNDITVLKETADNPEIKLLCLEILKTDETIQSAQWDPNSAILKSTLEDDLRLSDEDEEFGSRSDQEVEQTSSDDDPYDDFQFTEDEGEESQCPILSKFDVEARAEEEGLIKMRPSS